MSHAWMQPASSGPSGSWWAFALRGLVAVLFGLLVIIWLGFARYTLPLLITLLGTYILIDGIVTVVAGTRDLEGTGGTIARRNEMDKEWISGRRSL